MAGLDGQWAEYLKLEFGKPYYRALYQNVQNAYRTKTVYPPKEDIFTAFHLTPPDRVKVVILGQDPYHEPGEAHGLAFSVKPGVAVPPSLQNIYKELHDDLGCPVPSHGYLKHWADEGVLLLNSLLTVEAHRAFSHKDFGWERFTDAAIRALNMENRPMVFILWGSAAIRKKELITNADRLILTSPHPSPLSAYRGFFGSRPFSKANEYLLLHNIRPVDWTIPEITDTHKAE
ncbi:MAG: uracil-DNA glycosylase [Lachnospiraceae bacterium]|nr:uracil-DNA glycosylase [Lachnospiraceae bacterium]